MTNIYFTLQRGQATCYNHIWAAPKKAQEEIEELTKRDNESGTEIILLEFGKEKRTSEIDVLGTKLQIVDKETTPKKNES
jgi:hypothetical protein